MKIKLTILALLILAAYTCSAQKTLIVSGEITDMHALPITESYVKVFKAGQKAPIKYFATGAGNTFSFSLQITTSDSLYLSVSNPKKQEYTELIKIEEGNTRLHYRIELLPSVVNLDSLL